MSEPLRIQPEPDQPALHHTDQDRNDAPLRTKVSLMIILAVVGGAAVGMLEAHLGHVVWPMWLGLLLLAGGLLWLARVWVWLPLAQLLEQLDHLNAQARPATMGSVLVDRKDEIGRLARGIDRYSIRGRRDYYDAKRLRRSLDQGLEQATRHATRQLRQMAMHDPLTGLGNRRFLEENLDLLVAPLRHSGTELVCIAIDLDNFKQVNDTFGHAAGDDLLRFLADLIRSHKRPEDYGVRLGGDEFVLLMPGCGVDRAQAVVGRLVSLFRHHVQTKWSEPQRPDLSVGIAALTQGVMTGRHLLEAADKNLYAAKRAGKGQVVSI